MSLSKIRLELARDHDFPDGSRDRGYEFTAPLADDGRISESDWETNRARCRVRRFWSGEALMRSGILFANREGPGPFITTCLAIRTMTRRDTALRNHRFVPGEYVSIKEHDDVLRTFKVMMVQPLE